MDWDKLKSFHAAAETGSLTAAAERLAVSQSALSRQIAALEESLGSALFQRHSRGLILTEAGRLLLKTTREMAASAAAAESVLRDARDRPEGDLSVVAPMAFGTSWLTPRLPNFARSYPHVRLKLRLEDREVDVAHFESEAAISLWPTSNDSLIQRKFLTFSFGLYAAHDYLAREGAPSTPQALDRHRLIAYGAGDDGPLHSLDWAVWLGRDEKEPRREAGLTVNNVLAILRACDAGLGIATLPDYVAAENPHLVRLFEDLPQPAYDVYFQYPQELRGSQRLEAFRRFLMDESRIAES
jgi:DNA-binding transcriptional LysR family regulator